MFDLKKRASVLTDRVKESVGKKKGVRNDTLERFCRLACTDNFRGVYSVDRLPFKLTARPSFIVIVNLGKKDGKRRWFGDAKLPPGHFIAVIATPRLVYYFDPFGRGVHEDQMERFLNMCDRTIRVNRKQLQSLESNYCGLYCILISCYADGRMNDVKLRFLTNKKRLKENDKLCSQYLTRMFEIK